MNVLPGIPGWDDKLETKNKFTYIINSFSIGLVALFQIFYIAFIREPLVIAVTFICLAVLFSVFFFLKIKKYNIAKIVMILGFLFQEFSLVFLWFPREANFNYFFFIVAPISFFIYDFDILFERISLITVNVIAMILILLSELITFGPPLIEISHNLARMFTILSLASTIGSITVVFYFYASNLSAINSELRLLAETDVLTRVFNRRSLDKEGKLQFELSQKYHKTFSLIILDIDFFKNVNDSFGHPAGDEVLIQMSELLSSRIRHNDLIARYGGEEFALLLRDTRPEGSFKTAEMLKSAVEQHDFIISDGRKIKLTISLGTVSFSKGYDSFDEMIRLADKALYKAKEGGRNMVVQAEHS